MEDRRSSPSLHDLLAEVVRARAAQDAVRHRPVGAAQADQHARRETLRALENYVAALEDLSWPVPRAINEDLRLHRSLCGLTKPMARPGY